jgi:hypothetical protein
MYALKVEQGKERIHAPVAEHKAQQILENPESRDAFLFLAPAGSEECSNSVIGVKSLQCCADLPLFKFLILCYACHGKDVVHRADENMYKNKKKK